MKRLLIAAAIALAGVSAAHANDRSAERHYFACKSTTDLEAIIAAVKEAVTQNKQEVFNKISDRVFPRKQCTMLSPGQRVAVERTNERGQHCVRTTYDPQCFWTDEAAFHPQPPGEP